MLGQNETAVAHTQIKFWEHRLQSKVVFNQRLIVVFHQWSSSIYVVFHGMQYSIKGHLHLPSKVIFRSRVSVIEGHFPSKFVFNLRLSFIEGCRLQLKVICHIPSLKVAFILRSSVSPSYFPYQIVSRPYTNSIFSKVEKCQNVAHMLYRVSGKTVHTFVF